MLIVDYTMILAVTVVPQCPQMGIMSRNQSRHKFTKPMLSATQHCSQHNISTTSAQHHHDNISTMSRQQYQHSINTTISAQYRHDNLSTTSTQQYQHNANMTISQQHQCNNISTISPQQNTYCVYHVCWHKIFN